MAFTYTGEGVQERPAFKLAPEGDYMVQIIKGEEKISKNSKNMIVLTAQIMHPEYKNQIFTYIVDNKYAQQRIFDIMTSCGITPSRGMAVTPQTFVNRVGKVRIKHEEYNGEKTLRISLWKKQDTASAPAPSFVSPAPQKTVAPEYAPASSLINTAPDAIPF